MLKNARNKFILCSVLCVILIGLFIYRYQILNAPIHQYKTHVENLNLKESTESAGILLTFNSIEKKKTYDSDLKCNVYQYRISFHVKNISNETFNLNNKIIPQLVLVSAKQKYYAEPISDSTLKPHSSATKDAYISVIKEDSIPSDLYKSYKLYFIQNEQNNAFIYKIKTI